MNVQTVKLNRDIKLLYIECLKNGEISTLQAEAITDFLVSNDLSKRCIVNFVTHNGKGSELNK